MVLAGFADLDTPQPMVRERPYGEAEHVVWSVPPQAATGLSDRPVEWPVERPDFGDQKTRGE